MKKIVFLSCVFVLATILIGCGQKSDRYGTPEKVVITGKANNLSAETNALNATLFRLGLEPEQVSVPVDETGNFQFEFETYAPSSVSIQGLSTLTFSTFPSDNIHVEFDGGTRNHQTFFNSLNLTGDRVETNRAITAFHFMYLVDPVLPMRGKTAAAIKNYPPEQFLLHLDTLQYRWKSLYDKFVDVYSPDREAKRWAKTHIDASYVNDIGEYCLEFEQNAHHGEREFPRSFRDKMFDLLPLSEDMFIDVEAINTYTKRFYWGYLNPLIMEYLQTMGIVSGEGDFTGTEAELNSMDSLLIEKILEFTPDRLLKQLVLTEHLRHHLYMGRPGIAMYEKNRKVIDQYITLPYLKEPLEKFYLSTKKNL